MLINAQPRKFDNYDFQIFFAKIRLFPENRRWIQVLGLLLRGVQNLVSIGDQL